MSEPLLTCSIPTSELINLVETPMTDVPDFPCHTQSVERAIRRVSEASVLANTAERRDGIILSQIEACKMLPKNNTKKDFENLVENVSIG